MVHIPKAIFKYTNTTILLESESYLYYKTETDKLTKKEMKLMSMNYLDISFKTTSPSHSSKALWSHTLF